jgi:hypothetical protein
MLVEGRDAEGVLTDSTLPVPAMPLSLPLCTTHTCHNGVVRSILCFCRSSAGILLVARDRLLSLLGGCLGLSIGLVVVGGSYHSFRSS